VLHFAFEARYLVRSCCATNITLPPLDVYMHCVSHWHDFDSTGHHAFRVHQHMSQILLRFRLRRLSCGVAVNTECVSMDNVSVLVERYGLLTARPADAEHKVGLSFM